MPPINAVICTAKTRFNYLATLTYSSLISNRHTCRGLIRRLNTARGDLSSAH
jgi:hypothetical protein